MRVLWLSDGSNSSTGFASQSRLLMMDMHRWGHEVIHVAHNYIGQPIFNFEMEDNLRIPYKMIGGDPRAPYCQTVLPEYLAKYKPDVFGTLLDTFMLFPWICNMPISCKTVGWWPSDGGWFPQGCENVLKRFNRNVMMAKFGQEQVKRLFNLDTLHIPHGVKSLKFRPMKEEDRHELRQVYGDKALYVVHNGNYAQMKVDLNKKFVVGCVARNQPRKMMDRLIKSFCLFAKGKEDVILLLHSDFRDMAAGFNLQDLADRYGEGRKVYWTGIKWFDNYSVDRMVEIYNLFNVHFLLTSGEGFGVPFIEAMSCGIPNVATNYTTTKELITDHQAGLGVRLMSGEDSPYPAEQLLDGTLMGTFMVDRAMASIKHGAECLDTLYTDWKEQGGQLAKDMGKRGRDAVLAHYDWDNCVAPAWKKLLEEMQT